MKKIYLITFPLVCLAVVPPCQANPLTTFLKEASQFITERFGRAGARDAAQSVAGKVTQAGAEIAVRRSAAKVIEESAEQLARRAGLLAAHVTDDAARAVVRYGSSATGLLNRFGQEAAGALAKVSGRNGRRLVMMEDELAKSGQASSLLKLVGSKGDAVVEWLWNNKALVATGVGATMLLTKPEAVLNAGASVANTAINVVGNGVVKPITEGLVWLITRLLLMIGLACAGMYSLWLLVPAFRTSVGALAQTSYATFKAKRK
jgi:hypothetical protein